MKAIAMDPSILTPAEAEAEARRIVNELPESLVVWMNSQGLTWDDLRDEEERLSLKHGWAARGRTWAYSAWINEAGRLLMANRVTKSRRVATRIARRFVDGRMAKSADLIRPMQQHLAEMDHWPVEVQWVLRHPLLHYKPGEHEGFCDACRRPFTDPVMRAMVNEYERTKKAPNDAAVLLLKRCLENPKLQDDFLKELLKPKPVVVEEEEVREVNEAAEERLARLSAEFDELMASDSD